MTKPLNENSKKHIPISLPIILLAAIALLFTGIVTARYLMENQKSGIIAAQNFYFTSNFLKEDASTEYYIDPQNSGFVIELYNYEDAKRITSVDIGYQVTVSGGTTASVSGTLLASVAGKHSLTIVPMEHAKTVTVTVESTTPYQKTLTAKFHLTSGNSYTLEDTVGASAAALNMIYTGSGQKSVSIVLPAGVIPDATDDRISSSKGTYTYTFPKAGVYTLVLLKSDTTKSFSGSGVFADSITISLT